MKQFYTRLFDIDKRHRWRMKTSAERIALIFDEHGRYVGWYIPFREEHKHPPVDNTTRGNVAQDCCILVGEHLIAGKPPSMWESAASKLRLIPWLGAEDARNAAWEDQKTLYADAFAYLDGHPVYSPIVEDAMEVNVTGWKLKDPSGPNSMGNLRPIYTITTCA